MQSATNLKLEGAAWNDSQKAELEFWTRQRVLGNGEQLARNDWYRYHCFPDYFRGRHFEGLVLVDLGSGPTGILHVLPAALARTAADPLMDEFAKLGYNTFANGVVPLATAAEQVELTAKCVDVVFMLNMLDHTSAPAQCLSEAARILKPGGTLVLCADMRSTALLDQYHKLQLTESWLDSALPAAGFNVTWKNLVPHQAGNPTVQYCALCERVKL
jgi:ubiquinone/menaquinone biosynthesis C-methylase UbiE